MKLLLDTHVLFWTLADSPRLSRRVASLVSDFENRKLVSPVSAYEICAKHALGKLPEAAALAANFHSELAPLDVEWLPISPAHAIAAGKLDMAHRDPFDRLLIAQALVEQIALVSSDDIFDRYGVERIW